MESNKNQLELYNPKYLPFLTLISPFLAAIGYFSNFRKVNKTKLGVIVLIASMLITFPFSFFMFNSEFSNFMNSSNQIFKNGDFNILYICFRYVVPFIIADLLSRSLSPSELKKQGFENVCYGKSFLPIIFLYILFSILAGIFIFLYIVGLF